MKTINLHLYNALMRKINLNAINPGFCNCDFCEPQCQDYEVRLFSKKFKLEICFTHNYASISSNSIKYCDITIDLSEINFYNNHLDLLK
jgi:hypothetical protein